MVYGVELQRRPPVRLDPHADAPASDAWREWALRQERPRAVDLFSGAGGLSLGIERAGYKVVLAVDHDARSIDTHRHNFPGCVVDVDLSQAAGVSAVLRQLHGIPISLIAGGPPCQPYSRAGRSKIRSLVRDGKRNAIDARRGLWQSFLQIVEGVQPEAVLLENVPDMALGDDFAVLREILDKLEGWGYEPQARLVDAWRHGVPQHRQRLIVVAVRPGGVFEWPNQKPRVTVRDAIQDLPQIRGTTGKSESRYRGARTAFQRRARVGMINGSSDVVWDHVTRAVRVDDRDAFSRMRPNTRYSDLPEHLRRYRSDIFDDKYKRLGWEELSRSITAHIAKDGYWYIHPSQPRTLSVREAARIQTFPDRFRFAGSRSDAFRQIGNAVPPALAKAVASSLRRATRASSRESSPSEQTTFTDARARLLAWSNSGSVGGPWAYRGNAWATLAAVVLDGRLSGATGLTAAFLEQFPDPSALRSRPARSWAASRDARIAARVMRLVTAARQLARGFDAWFDTGWADKGGISDAQADIVRLIGLADDGVLVTTGTLRVVTRLTGTTPRNRSDALMLLSHLVGTGLDVPARNAALGALGSTVCTARRRQCKACPLAEICRSARRTQRRRRAPGVALVTHAT